MEIMDRNELTNQRAAFDTKSLEHDGMGIMCDGHLGEFTVPT